MEMEDLLEEADQLFEQAEEMIVKEPGEGLQKFRTGVGNLFKAFLLSREKMPLGEIKQLYTQCREIEPEFETIRDELDYLFIPKLAETDSELICDAANEVWDLVISMMPE
ncbi:MAG TPA: hypothetical protein DDW65_15090 [Firmicutes bacterium]|jgi:hypothetical protein|nr:hypothetical protein [Bacillota bacterium]